MATNAEQLKNAIIGWVRPAGAIGSSLDFAIGTDIGSMYENHPQATDFTGAIIYAGFAAIGQLPHVGGAKTTYNGVGLRWTIPRNGDGTDLGNDIESPNFHGITIDAANMNTLEPKAIVIFFRMVISVYPSAPTYLTDLVAAYQVKGLTAANIENYFKMKNSPRVQGRRLLPFIQTASSLLPNFMRDAALRVTVGESDWIKYHTAATSTPHLVLKVMELVNNKLPNLFSNTTRRLVTDAVAEIWAKDRADMIPKRAVAIAYIFLEEFEMLPEKWYQGTKAIEEMSITFRTDMENIAKGFKKLDKTTIDLAKIKDMTALNVAIVESLRG